MAFPQPFGACFCISSLVTKGIFPGRQLCSLPCMQQPGCCETQPCNFLYLFVK